jgi:hypothetical protein
MLVSFICVVEHTCTGDERWVPIGMYNDYLIWDADDPVDYERGFGMSHVIITHVPHDSRPGLSPHLPGF